MKQSYTEKDIAYELFFLAVSLLAIANLVLRLVDPDEDVRDVALVVNRVLSGVLLFDFGYRLATARSKRTYVVSQFGWADALAGLPINGFQLWRVFHIVRTLRLIRRERSAHLAERYLEQRATSALLTVGFMIICVVEFGSIEVITAERNAPDANIDTASDALWWSYVTITTVGYGDLYPVTDRGRNIGVLMLTAGVGLFSVLTGYLANAFLSPRRRRSDKTVAQPQSPVDLAAIRNLLDEQDRISAELRKRLAALEGQPTGSVAKQDIESDRPTDATVDTPRLQR